MPPKIEPTMILTRSASLAFKIEFVPKSFFLAAIDSRSESNSIPSSPKSTQHGFSEDGSWIAKKLQLDFNHPLSFQLKSSQIPYHPKLCQQEFSHARHRSPYKSNSLQNLFSIAAMNSRSESNSIPRSLKSTQH